MFSFQKYTCAAITSPVLVLTNPWSISTVIWRVKRLVECPVPPFPEPPVSASLLDPFCPIPSSKNPSFFDNPYQVLEVLSLICTFFYQFQLSLLCFCSCFDPDTINCHNCHISINFWIEVCFDKDFHFNVVCYRFLLLFCGIFLLLKTLAGSFVELMTSGDSSHIRH